MNNQWEHVVDILVTNNIQHSNLILKSDAILKDLTNWLVTKKGRTFEMNN